MLSLWANWLQLNSQLNSPGVSFWLYRTLPNLMILVSFSSAEDALSNSVNKYNTFSSQGTEKTLFRFFWDTQYLSLS